MEILTTMMGESQTEVELMMGGCELKMLLVLINVRSVIRDITRMIKPIQLLE